MTLIEHYQLEVFTPPCSPESIRFAAKVQFAGDIREVLPYLNAELDGAQYNPAAPALTWRRDAHHIVFNVNEIAIGNLVDRAEAEVLARELVDLVNRT
jgi:ArsR family metal-binding transcriptional regulator